MSNVTAPSITEGETVYYQSLDRNTSPSALKTEFPKKGEKEDETWDFSFLRSSAESIINDSNCRINLPETKDRGPFNEEKNQFQIEEGFKIIHYVRQMNNGQDTHNLQYTDQISQDEHRRIRLSYVQLFARSENFSNISGRRSHFLWEENLNPMDLDHMVLNPLRSLFGQTSTEYAAFSYYSTNNSSGQENRSDDPFNLNFIQQALYNSLQVFYGPETQASSSYQEFLHFSIYSEPCSPFFTSEES